MRAAVCTAYGPPEVLQVRERRTPVPGRREMRVRIRGRKTSVPPPPSDVPQVDRGQYNRNDEGDDSPNQDKQLTMRGGLYELPARYQQRHADRTGHNCGAY